MNPSYTVRLDTITTCIRTEPHAYIEIGSHSTLFFMVNVALRVCAPNNNDDNVTQHGGYPANTKSCSPCLQNLFFYIGHPFYGLLTPFKTRYPLTNIM